LGLSGAIIEVGTRICFYMMFMKKGLSNPLMSSEEKMAYAKRGKLWVQVASNGIVVEVIITFSGEEVFRQLNYFAQYVSSIVASMFLIYLAATCAYAFCN